MLAGCSTFNHPIAEGRVIEVRTVDREERRCTWRTYDDSDGWGTCRSWTTDYWTEWHAIVRGAGEDGEPESIEVVSRQPISIGDTWKCEYRCPDWSEE